MDNYNKIVGDYGEGLVRDFLVRKGYEIIDMNKKISYKEIDIIAKISGITVFIEVKTRTSASLGTADEAFSERKMDNLKKAIVMYIEETEIDENMVRLDLISVDIDKSRKMAKIKHYIDAI